MKKIISVCLAVALAASMLCMNIFAAGTPVVGHYGETGEVADGITASEFGDTNSSSEIKFTFSTESEHRYAVDIEFTDTAKTFGANFVWDVNKHQYVPNGTETADDTEITIDPKLTITNHSDLSVYYKTTIEAANVTGLTITPSGAKNSTEVAKSNIGAATVVTNADALVKVAPAAGSWSAYINGGNGAVTDVKVATYTVIISMSEITG